MTPEEKEQRAFQADRILRDPLVQEALASLENTIIRDWRNTKQDQVEHRENLWRQLHAAGAFVGYLTRCIVTGKIMEKAADGNPSDGSSERPGS